VKQEYLMIKGTCQGCPKRPITLRKAIVTPSSSIAKEEIQLKFIDTTSQYGAGRFQTIEEKREWFGPTKKDRLAEKKAKKAGKGGTQDDDDDENNKFKSKSQQKKAKGSRKKASAKKASKKKTETQKVETQQKAEAK